MVKQIKEAGKRTGQTITNIYEIVVLATTTAAAIKVVTLPEVSTGAGNLPIWQIVAAVLLAGVATKLYTLQSK